MARRYWTCRKCSWRNERTASRKCQNCSEQTKPKKRVPKHAEVLRDVDYETWADLSQEIHGGDRYACGVCGGLPTKTRRHDRDHDHRKDSVAYGKPRGLTHAFCNRELLRNATLEQARQVVAYLERVDAWYRNHQAEGVTDERHDSGSTDPQTDRSVDDGAP